MSHTEFVPDLLPLHDQELGVELLPKLALPLESQVGRTHDEDAFCEAPQLKLPDQQARHDRLPRTAVDRQKEPHPCELEKIVVPSFRLAWQGVDPGKHQSEVRS